jgi:hypothetical protein
VLQITLFVLHLIWCRIDNFTGQPLHVQQHRCEAEDIIRPYSCLPYAWDEPSQAHLLSVQLPGMLMTIDDLPRKIATMHASMCTRAWLPSPILHSPPWKLARMEHHAQNVYHAVVAEQVVRSWARSRWMRWAGVRLWCCLPARQHAGEEAAHQERGATTRYAASG